MCQPEFFNGFLSHDIFLYFSGNRCWKAFHKQDVVGDFKPCHLVKKKCILIWQNVKIHFSQVNEGTNEWAPNYVKKILSELGTQACFIYCLNQIIFLHKNHFQEQVKKQVTNIEWVNCMSRNFQPMFANEVNKTKHDVSTIMLQPDILKYRLKNHHFYINIEHHHHQSCILFAGCFTAESLMINLWKPGQWKYSLSLARILHIWYSQLFSQN